MSSRVGVFGTCAQSSMPDLLSPRPREEFNTLQSSFAWLSLRMAALSRHQLRNLTLKFALRLMTAITLSACGTNSGIDPVYAALVANPPTSIPAKHLARLRKGKASCDVFNKGKPSQYMTCWWPSGIPVSAVALTYYGANPIAPPRPEKLITPGSRTITAFPI